MFVDVSALLMFDIDGLEGVFCFVVMCLLVCSVLMNLILGDLFFLKFDFCVYIIYNQNKWSHNSIYLS